MRPDPRKPKRVFIGLAVNQNHIRFDVAIAETFVGSGKGMVAVFDRQRFVDDQQLQHRLKYFLEIAVIGMRLELFQVFPENSSGFNRPHSCLPTMP